MDFTGLVIAILIGLVIGWVAGELWRGFGFGTIGNIIVGALGAVVGSLLFGALGISSGGILGTILMGVIGALVLLFIVGLVSGETRYD
ncbi:MAG TPA: GlsB/YeaQ/YmgE family stress response membrane protein [Aggregatilineales bacterium]|jgi:uncharacterized membrane protein YeaQ/YmgE (transglycosylase-associated protein family)|nr:GlsB/YeaQ/YmgE family stress response membrane protein [Chloroflexota bacterium]HOA22382.1 GlsB/YeaQ/YmgE family stress response membrane protein [Aggregatilineales bacterium]HPV07501.1 GlsB/YeaQ/YmgE family stress response membrane protein [Aggregatilineales bacterium]HQA67900.1 GlsB/YeaQ/YmgE family stress response membrane protein [Aggregatilineales bacterium]HQE18893.1 GlsB/YeaQ/YmgE family stress response membrane protein [Aggregatilineales bacterium]